MRVRSPGRRPRRPAFTLIELLVVMTIMVILATLVYFLLPGFLNREKASKGADLVQQWLLTAKQRALRDQSPRGVRLNIDNFGLVRTINYIEKPADFTTGYLDPNTTDLGVPPPAAPGPYTIFAIRGVNGADWQTNPPVAQYDYLYIPTLDTGPWHLISQPVGYGPAPNFTPYITIQGPGYTGTLTAPIQYAISRAPRLLEGEETLQLPQDVVIDMRSGWSLPPGSYGPSGGTQDILFTPGGAVANLPSGVANPAKLILWVRDLPQNPDPNAFLDPRGSPAGTPPSDPKAIPTEQSLIVVYCRTGLIAAHPPAMNAANADLADPTNPYQFAQDGQSSGL